MEVCLKINSRKAQYPIVNSWSTAQRVVREFIEEHDLGAGCSDGDAFTGGDVYEDGKKIGHISYNGRAWDLKGKEIV